jgi:hypothetical protein
MDNPRILIPASACAPASPETVLQQRGDAVAILQCVSDWLECDYAAKSSAIRLNKLIAARQAETQNRKSVGRSCSGGIAFMC